MLLSKGTWRELRVVWRVHYPLSVRCRVQRFEGAVSAASDSARFLLFVHGGLNIAGWTVA